MNKTYSICLTNTNFVMFKTNLRNAIFTVPIKKYRNSSQINETIDAGNCLTVLTHYLPLP